MFSGIVESIGIITSAAILQDCLHIHIKPHTAFTDLNIGDSVSVNGVCLTVTELINDTFKATIVPETLRLTNLSQMTKGDAVNLERSITLSTRLGGHYVQGHVDGKGEIIDLQNDGKDAWLLKIKIPAHLGKYIVNKGYITLDGMSITVIEAVDDWFTVTLIPHTRAVTIAQQYRIGTLINIEVDILSKYVEKLMRTS